MRTTLVILLGLLTATPLLPAAAGESADQCGALPPPTGGTTTVSTEAALQAAVDSLSSGETILIEPGTYQLTNTLNIRDVDDVTIRSSTGDRDDVVLRGNGMANSSYGNVPHVIAIYASDGVTIADVTLADAYFHGIQVHGEDDADNVLMHNLRVVDMGEQLVKVSTAGAPGPYADGGVLQCSLIEFTDRARSWYTNGIDVLAGSDWVVRDNTFRNIRAPEGELAGPAVLFWRNSIDTVVERNLFIECDRGIALGLSEPDANSRDGETTYDHQGGVIRNNMITRVGPGDVGITVNHARDVVITHNTVMQFGTFPWGGIEYRFGSTTATITNNLLDAPIWERDGGAATTAGNITTADTGWFVDAPGGDLHLASASSAPVGAAVDSSVVDDYDGAPRPVGSGADVGADEFGVGVQTGPFADVPADHPFVDAIEWLVANDITRGCTTDGAAFCPDADVTRAQMASFLARALGLPSSDLDSFTDDDGSTHEAAIEAVAAAGITLGCDTERFCPDDVVTRAQMASFLARALGLVPTTDHGFADVDGGPHAGNIGAIAADGITLGCDVDGTRYCPDVGVTRGQMAAFLFRALGN